MDALYNDPQWKWLEESMKNLSATNSNAVTAEILNTMHRTGKTQSALIAHLLRTIRVLTMKLEAEKDNVQSLKNGHDEEKKQLLQLMYTINQSSIQSSNPPSSNASSSNPSSSDQSSSSTSSGLSGLSGLTVSTAMSKNRDKSPKRDLQSMVDNERDKLKLEVPEYPSNNQFPEVIEFMAINPKNAPFEGGYMCNNCNTVVVSTYKKNNQRTFKNHLLKCKEYIAKKFVGADGADGEKANGDDGTKALSSESNGDVGADGADGEKANGDDGDGTKALE